MPTWDTAGNIIRDAAVELGLLPGSYADDPYSATNDNTLLLVRLLKSLGQELIGEHEWGQLRREWEFLTGTGGNEYALPDGFDRMVNQTAWDLTSQNPLGGPVSAQHRQLIKARSSTGVVLVPFHVTNNALILEPASPDGHTVRYEYVTEFWVAAAGSADTSKAAPTLQTDELWFSRQLLVKGLKFRFLEARGFDTTASGAAYARELNRAIGSSEPSPVLRLDGGSGHSEEPLISERNVPDTGYGS